MDLITYALAKKYIKASLAGAGALKGDKGDPGEAAQGCGSVIGISAIMVSGLAIAGACLALRRKERE